MRPFQLFQQLKSQFWNTVETAGPTLVDVLRFWDHPRPLRIQARRQPPPIGPWKEPERLGVDDAEALQEFWWSCYSGEDWVFRPEVEWIRDILGEAGTVALAVREHRRIVGSIVCRNLSVASNSDDNGFQLGPIKLPTAYMIEGLCIDPAWRGKHIAGWLIAWIDHLMNQKGPQAFFWSREAPPRDLTYIASHTYGYLQLREELRDLGRDVGSAGIVEVPWTEFRRIWTTYIPRWEHLHLATFPTQLPHDPLRVWRVGANYVVVSDTRRWTRKGYRIWEVQFCGDLYDPTKGVVPEEEGRRMLEAVGSILFAEAGKGLLFVTSASWQGGCTSNWSRPWVVGTAGFHTTYIYNYMPPAFHRMATLFLRNEL